MTGGRKVLLALAGLGAAVAVYRLVYGLGASTNLSDRWPWGLWVWWDVLTGVALAGGGYSTTLLVRFLGRERWRTVERGAFLTSLLGYLMVVTGLILDLGRWPNAWRAFLFWEGNPHSVMFELTWCVGGYTVVQLAEFLYVFDVRMSRLSRRVLEKIYAPLLIVGVILPFLHQSALGSLYVITMGRLDPLWWSMLLPLFFLMSSFFVGPAMVVVENTLSARSHGQRPPVAVLGEMVRLSAFVMLAYLGLKVADLAWRGVLSRVFEGSTESTLFLIEIVCGVVVPTIVFLRPSLRGSPAWLVTASALTVGGVALNRANVVFAGMASAAGGASYRPDWMEAAVTLGIIATGILAYLFVVENFPIVSPETHDETPARHPENARFSSGSAPLKERPADAISGSSPRGEPALRR